MPSTRLTKMGFQVRDGSLIRSRRSNMRLLCCWRCVYRLRIAYRRGLRNPLRDGHRICESHMLSLDGLSHGRSLGRRRSRLRSGCCGWCRLGRGIGSSRSGGLLVGRFWRRFRRRCWWGSRTTTRRSLRRRLLAGRGGADERRHCSPASTLSNMDGGERVGLHGRCV
jgi:hypothetical protein